MRALEGTFPLELDAVSVLKGGTSDCRDASGRRRCLKICKMLDEISEYSVIVGYRSTVCAA